MSDEHIYNFDQNAPNHITTADGVAVIECLNCAKLREALQRLTEVAQWAQAVLTALNVGDIESNSPLHLKLREVMITYRKEAAALLEKP